MESLSIIFPRDLCNTNKVDNFLLSKLIKLWNFDIKMTMKFLTVTNVPN